MNNNVNPCPCGYLGHPKKECKCSDKQIRRYRGRMSGPILDRIDLHVRVPMVEIDKLTDLSGLPADRLSSKVVREIVNKSRKIQEERFKGQEIYTNSQMKNKHVRKYCSMDSDTQRILRLAVERFDLSARAYFRLIKVARTIADLEGEESIKVSHMAEALQYRQVN